MAIKTGKELAAACENVAKNYKTLYVNGCFGWPMTATMKQRAKKEQAYNRKPDRAPKIDAASADTFGFDCVCMIKALLWGWNGDKTKSYGGATYTANGVPDIDADQMIQRCKGVSTNFSNIKVGEALWIQGHIGIYIGNGLAVECTPRWKDGVQITAVHNIGTKSGYNGRKWTKHGCLPWVTYEDTNAEKTPTVAVKPAEQQTCSVALPVLRFNAKGDCVGALQALLIGKGYDLGKYGPDRNGIDEHFGLATENAVEAFQEDNKLEVDGVCGPKTWAKLLGV